MDATHWLTGSHDHTVKLWDRATSEVALTLDGGSSINAVAFDREHIATGGDDQTARLFCRATGQVVLTLEGHDREVAAVAMDASHVFTGSVDSTARLWDRTTGEVVRTVGHDRHVWSVARVTRARLLSRAHTSSVAARPIHPPSFEHEIRT